MSRTIPFFETPERGFVSYSELTRDEAVASLLQAHGERPPPSPYGFLDFYVRSYDGFLRPEFCSNLIALFEQNPSHHESFDTPGFRFRQMQVERVSPGFTAAHAPLFVSAARCYQAGVNAADTWPAQFSFEALRVKRYLPGTGDAFPPHVDVGDHASARRFLIMFCYLNDVAEGGETAMVYGAPGLPPAGQVVSPRQGRLLCFPPAWPWRHEGRPPVSGPKYLLQTYLHYQGAAEGRSA